MKKIKRFQSITIILAVIIIAINFLSCKDSTEKVSKPINKIDKSLLVGNWIRTDAEYQIKISDVANNGVMNAQYFNPRPINVSKSEWVYAEGFLRIYVELRDENYPGSNYNLTYIPERDMFVGDYFQAVEGFTYYVEFARNK